MTQESVTVDAAEIIGRDLVVSLSDGRRILAPLTRYPRLDGASQAALRRFRLSPFGIHWADLDEDVGLGSLLTPDAAAAPPVLAKAS